MTDLILVRHGETEWNRQLRFQGHGDMGLNATGLEQARRVAERLAGEAVGRVYASDLLRARQTAEPASRQLMLAMVTDPAFREQDFGLVDGMSVDEIKATHPLAWDGWLRFEEDYCLPGAESTRQFHARVMAAFHRTVAAHPHETLLVVTHGGVLDMVYRSARSLGLNGPRQSEIPNAGINRVRMSASAIEIEIVEWADVRHLADLPAQPVYDQKKLLASEASQSDA